MKRLGALLWLGLAGVLAAAPIEVRLFTAADGRILRGAITALDEHTVTVRRADDAQVFTLRIETLSTHDQTFLAREREAIREALAPLPETDFIRALRADFALINSRRSGLVAPPDDAWARTRRFVVLYGYHESRTPNTTELETFARIHSGDTAVLWLGPSAGNREPTPEADLKIARLLPTGIAVIRREALIAGAARAQAELDRLAEEESPGRPDLFYQSVHQRSAAELLVWQSRVRGVLPPYWPAAGFLPWLGDVPTNRTNCAYLLDREGAPLAAEHFPRELAGLRTGTVPPPAAQKTRDVASTGSALATGAALADPVEHEFVNRQGGRLRARLLAIGNESLRVERVDDRREFLLSRRELSEADQKLVAGWAQDARYVADASPAPLPPRPGAEGERALSGRFAADVFLGESRERDQLVRWARRPRLIVFAETPEQEALVRANYETLCTAAGLVGLAEPALELVIGVGRPSFLRRNRAALDLRLPEDSGHWSWNYRHDTGHALTSVRLAIALPTSLVEHDRYNLARRTAMAFGIMGQSSPGWRESIFHPDGLVTAYSEADQRLLRVVYRHVAPGERREQLEELVGKNWAEPDAAR